MFPLLTLMLVCLGMSPVDGQLHGLVPDPTTVKDKSTASSICEPRPGVKFMSQFLEDQIIIDYYYKHKCGGTVVEMGGFDGKTFSNSWYFEHALGWKTLLVEAFPNNYSRMVKNRPNAINVFGAVCLGESVEFQVAPHGATGGVASDMTEVHMKKFIRNKQNEVIQVPCHQVTDVLVDNGIGHVDVFFLDVEGGELTVLQTIDWGSGRTPQIDMFVIEMDGTNPLKDEAVRAVLRAHGYVKAPFNIRAECKRRKQEQGDVKATCIPSEVFVLEHVLEQFHETQIQN